MRLALSPKTGGSVPAGPGSTTGREFAVVLAGAFLLACLMHWPLPLHLDRDVVKDAGDPLLQAWQLAWNGHALLHQQLHWWDANLFFPEPDSLAFSDALVGYAPLAWIGSGSEAALARYNLIYLAAYALSVAGPYMLGRELGLGRGPALLAGIAFAWSPWRWEQSGHLHVISAGSIALCVALLLRGYRLGRPRAIVAGWAVAGWQVLIGVSLGLMLLYLLAVLTLVAGVLWWRAGRPRPERSVVRGTAAGLLLLVAALGFVAPAYLRVKSDHPESKRDIGVVELFSPPFAAFVSTSPDNPVWGKATEGARKKLTSVPEQTLFPGAVTVALAALGLGVAGAFSRRLRLGLLAAAALAFVFSLGLTFFDGRLTYRLLFDYAPGWDGIRTPGRLHIFTTLALALLAGAGAEWLAARARRPALAASVCALLIVPVLAEGSAFRRDVPGAGFLARATQPTPQPPPPGLASVPDPYIHLPPDDPKIYEYMLWSTDGFPKIVNGRSGFDPVRTVQLKQVAQTFPDRASVAVLRANHLRAVVVHRSVTAGTPWADAATRSLAGLGVRRRVQGDLVIFELGPQ